jgi:hypothetical protein
MNRATSLVPCGVYKHQNSFQASTCTSADLVKESLPIAASEDIDF